MNVIRGVGLRRRRAAEIGGGEERPAGAAH
jgi:hypothetical protein